MGEAETWLKPGEPPDELVVRLGPSGAVEGSVTNERGPMVGATVTVWPSWNATTDKAGHFRIDSLMPRTYQVHANAKGCQTTYVNPNPVVPSGGVARTAIQLRCPAGLTGLITDSKGAPLGDAELYIYPDHDPDAHDDASPKTDQQGRFSAAVGPGHYNLIVQRKGYAGQRLHIRVPVDDLHVALGPGGSIAGTLLDEKGPVASAEVMTYRLDGETPSLGPFSARTGEHGEFSFRDVPAGRWVVLAKSGQSHFDASWHDGVAPAKAVRHAKAVVQIEATQVTLVELKFGAGPAIRGFVRDEAGAPVPGAAVTAHREDERGEAWSSADGSFTIEGLDADKTYEVRAFRRGYPKPSEPISAQAGKLVSLVLPSPAWLTGRVLDPSGKPIPRFAVNEEEVTSNDGTFRTPAGRASPSPLHISAKGYAPILRMVDVSLKGSSAVGDLAMGPGHPLHGTLVDASSGAPIAPAQVFLNARPYSDSFTADAEAHPNDRGDFKLSAVGDQAVLSVYAPGYSEVTITLKPGEAELSIRLSRVAAEQTEKPEP